jgi:hypothetical protein
MEDDDDALGAPSALSAKGQGDTQTRRGEDGAPVAPADEAALGTDALGPPSVSASKAPGSAREGFLEMVANAGGESVALGVLDSEDGIKHACFSGGPHRFGLPSYVAAAWAANDPASGIAPVKLFRDRSLGTGALQAAMDEDGDALGPPSASASKGRRAGSCCDGDTPPHDGATALPTTAPGAMEVATVQAPPDDGATAALHANAAEADASVEAWARALLPTIPHPTIEYNLPVIDV